jgi:hypothetical protein
VGSSGNVGKNGERKSNHDRYRAVLNYDDGLDMGKAIDEYGEPTNLWLRHQETSTGNWMEVVLNYREKGIFVEIEAAVLNNSAYLEERNPIIRVIYMDPEQYDEVLSSRILFREDAEAIQEEIQPWKGIEVEYSEKSHWGCCPIAADPPVVGW